ncbi:MAG TPA: cytochrome P450, partial [Mycobacterium sp.]|nr:cytochrome P450 [Mycobacterium sp.]
MSVRTTDVTAARLPWDAADPYSFYEARRRDGDVVWDDVAQAWLVLGYDAARYVLGGSGWTSDPLANPVARASMQLIGPEFTKASMLFADGSNHDRLRGSVRDVFTRRAIAGLTEGVAAITSEVIGELPSGERFDFMSD